jgi:two-component system, chemotaxis family, chemotaxis protein CheY
MASILLIEDDPCLGMVLVDLLQSARHDVRHEENGVAALKAFRQWPADLIITDLPRPEMDGVETLRSLRREKPAVRLIAISDDSQGSSEHYINIAEQLGARRTLAKPFGAEEFLRAVREVLETP